MQSVGTRLHEARIKLGYTLEEINARTRISLKNLEAIEGDDLPKISSPFTYRSFVKQFANAVGLDYATIASDAEEASKTLPEPLVPGQEEPTTSYSRQFPSAPSVRLKSSFPWQRLAPVAGLMGAVLSAYLLWHYVVGSGPSTSAATPVPAAVQASVPTSKNEAPPADPIPQQQADAKQVVPTSRQRPAETRQTPVNESPDPPASAVPAGTEQLTPPSNDQTAGANTKDIPGDPAAASGATSNSAAENSQPSSSVSALNDVSSGPIHIELSATEPVWLSVSADGKTAYSGTLAAMEKVSFDGKEFAKVRTRNAGCVNIVFNGHALGPLGRPGQSRTLIFNKYGYEVVRGLGSAPRMASTGGL